MLNTGLIAWRPRTDQSMITADSTMSIVRSRRKVS